MNFLKTSLLAATMLAMPVALPAKSSTSPDTPVVTIDTGKLAGHIDNGALSWKGIPFAAAPIGPLRWRAPQPAASWTGVRDASHYGNDCMQVPFPSDAAPLGTPPAEDCLYANVWKPATANGKLPVMVWIYGGGFVNGGASPPTYSGANIAKQGIIFVSFNYRVGRFGTFAHPQLSKADEDGGLLGNYGYLDQIAALKWVQRNIAAFGGDPANVTIIGESAGGMSVHNLVTSPLSGKGLFQRAIAMSGGNAQSLGDGGMAVAEKVGVDFAQSKGIAPDDPQALDKLRALTADQVTDGLSMMQLFTPGPRSFSSPFVDGKIAIDSAKAYASGAFARVPMMIGATSDDMGGKAGFMIAGAREASGMISAKQVPVYAYRFSYVAESVGKPGAGHATDIPFFLDTQTIKYGEQTTARDNQMGRIISAYIVNFARTGDPNGTGLPRWPRYAKASDEIMDFAENGKAVPQKDPWGVEIDTLLASQQK